MQEEVIKWIGPYVFTSAIFGMLGSIAVIVATVLNVLNENEEGPFGKISILIGLLSCGAFGFNIQFLTISADFFASLSWSLLINNSSSITCKIQVRMFGSKTTTHINRQLVLNFLTSPLF